MIKSVRGTRDLLPPETALWNFVEAATRDVFRAYGFHEIRTPVLEDLSLFQRSVGEETDIVSKEMFAWEDQGGVSSSEFANYLEELQEKLKTGSTSDARSQISSWLAGYQIGRGRGQMLALRPENTAGVVRAYIEHKLWERPGVQKLFYMGPQFRRERPQKGRYRQFYQIGAESIGPPTAGSESPARDAEILEMLATLLDRLGIQNWTLELNSVGCANDRPRYHEALRQALSPVVAQMCADCQRRAVTNPLRVLDCKVPQDQPIIEKLPRIGDYLDEPCREHFQQVQDILCAVGVPFVINPRLVRGLDYYTRTAFEFTHGSLGAQNAILGGGRYDGLSEALGGPRAPGIGFAIGEDRLILSLPEKAEELSKTPDAYIAPLGAGMNREAARLARELRRHDAVIELGDESFRLKKSLETASKIGARYVIIVGENEVAADAFALKNLATGEQVTVPRLELAARLQAGVGS
jgi:histidyl-tRNA synthetase